MVVISNRANYSNAGCQGGRDPPTHPLLRCFLPELWVGLTPGALRELSVPTDPDNCHQRRQDPNQVKGSREPSPSPRCCKQTSSLSQLSKWVTWGWCLHRIYRKIWVCAELPGGKLRSGEILKFRHIPLYTVGGCSSSVFFLPSAQNWER